MIISVARSLALAVSLLTVRWPRRRRITKYRGLSFRESRGRERPVATRTTSAEKHRDGQPASTESVNYSKAVNPGPAGSEAGSFSISPTLQSESTLDPRIAQNLAAVANAEREKKHCKPGTPGKEEDAVRRTNSLLLQRLPSKSAQLDFRWAQIMCPDVVRYYGRVQLFAHGPPSSAHPVFSTPAAIVAVCLLSLVDVIARRSGAVWMLWAGSHLGALLHGGVLPWDDDLDIIVQHEDKQKLVRGIAKFNEVTQPYRDTIPEIRTVTTNCLKLFLSNGHSIPGNRHTWPFVDVFTFKVNGTSGRFHELDKNGLPKAMLRGKEGKASWPESLIFPRRDYSFAGLQLPGPRPEFAAHRYELDKCKSPLWNHRLEKFSMGKSLLMPELDCCALSAHFPFVYRLSLLQSEPGRRITGGLQTLIDNHRPDEPRAKEIWEVQMKNGTLLSVALVAGETGRLLETWEQQDQVAIDQRQNETLHAMRRYVEPETKFAASLPQSAFTIELAENTWRLPDRAFAEIMAAGRRGVSGEELTRQYARNLTVVEIDNTLSKHGVECRGSRNKDGVGSTDMRVLEYNAGQGRYLSSLSQYLKYLEFKHGLKNGFDVIMLNEMDLGMNRTGNLHTTRVLAHLLGMNYAWGVEFYELPVGSRSLESDENLPRARNAVGLTGNAILSKCALTEMTIFRDRLHAAYFSDKKTFMNAWGAEKRLGGRSLLSGKTRVVGGVTALYVGSTHKFNERQALDNAVIHQLPWIRQSGTEKIGVVVAGDQYWRFCQDAGLRHVDDRRHSTWEASCGASGQHRGDILCASSNLHVSAREATHRPCWCQLTLSDHSLTHVSLRPSDHRESR